MTEDSLPKSERESGNGIETFLFEYSLYLLTSARGTVDEPKIYGALRLVDGIVRLEHIYSKCPGLKKDKFLLEIKSEIQTNLDRVLKSEEEFAKFMDSLIAKFTDEIKRRYVPDSPSQ